jgi:predicted small secreted protein
MKTIVVIISLLTLTACGTVSGVGKDISSAADWTKEKMGGR